ncbi:hypothetical protein [Sphingomonas sp.]|uniref:hypothetical protein n=1 Tax=Sphingomonas sp. TaxID=28214 RepID=UPI002ED9F8BA
MRKVRQMKAFMLGGAALIAAAIAGPALSRPALTGQQRLDKELAGYTAGTPVRCIDYGLVRSSEIIPGVGILYNYSGRRKYLNVPKSGKNWLRWDTIPVTTLYGGQLCRIDSVRLIDRGTRMQSGFVILEDFIPYTKAKQAP